jgi:hypothetical protein
MTSRPILPTPLVSTDWLANHLGDPDLRVLDATAHLTGPESGSTVGWSLRRGLNDYLAAHIPGAAFADIIDDLSEPDGGALSKPARFAVPGRPAGHRPGQSGCGLRPRRALGDPSLVAVLPTEASTCGVRACRPHASRQAFTSIGATSTGASRHRRCAANEKWTRK